MLGQLGQTWTTAPGARHQEAQLGFKLRPSGSGTRTLRQQSRPGTGLNCQAHTQPQAGVASGRQQQAELSFQAPVDSTESSSSQLPSAPSSPSPVLQVGSKIAGRYEVLSVSSQQGSTTTYTARGPDGQKVAVKSLSLQSMANWNELEAFERESRALRAVGHGHAAIPTFVEVFEEDNMDRTFYLVQELVEGQTLAQRLAQGWRASPATLQHLASQLLQALQAMRQAAGGPISHNAITPNNIILKQTPPGLQACLVGFASAEQLPGDSESPAAGVPLAQPFSSAMLSERQASHAAASSSSDDSSWEVEVDNDIQPQPLMQSSSEASAQDAQLVTAALSEALATNVEYAAPEALGGEARMGASDAFSVGAVLAAAACGAAPHSGPFAQWEAPRGLEGSRMAAVIQQLMQPEWQRRLTPDQALAVLAGQPMPALPSPQRSAVASKPGLQGLAQRVLQLGRDARANADAAVSQQRQRQSPADNVDGSRQPRGSPIPAAVLGLAAATLFLGPSAPFFLFTFLPLLAAGSGGPRLAPAGIPYPRQPGMGFQVAPRGYVSPLQQQRMLRMMLARQQATQSARYMQQRRQQQMWGGFR